MNSPAQLVDLVAPDWASALGPMQPTVTELGAFLRTETAAGHRYLPAGPNVLRAFTRPLADVKVLIVGQDPYPTPGHAVGLSFSVDPRVWPLPKSLINIYRELRDDLGEIPPKHGDLSAWADQGVLLLNRVLTVAVGRTRVAPRQGLGAGDRSRHRLPGRSRPAPGGDPLGSRRASPPSCARGHAGDRERPSVAAVGIAWLLRLTSVQPRQRAAREAGCGAGGLGAAPG